LTTPIGPPRVLMAQVNRDHANDASTETTGHFSPKQSVVLPSISRRGAGSVASHGSVRVL